MQIIAEIKGIRNNSEWSLSSGPGRGIIEIWYSIIQEEWGCGYADDDASNGNYPIWEIWEIWIEPIAPGVIYTWLHI